MKARGSAPGQALRRSLIVVVAALATLVPSASGAGKDDLLPPKPDRYVTDRAGVLPAQRAEALNQQLEKFEQETSNQVLVWTDRRVPEGFALEEFTVAAARKWAAGQSGKNNGVVLFVFTDERKMRIEVGYGLEGVLPDAIAHRIQEEEILPRFRQGDYADGIEAGAASIVAAIKGEYKGSGRTVAQRSGRLGGGSARGCIWVIFFLLFLLPGLFRRSHRTFGRGGWTTGFLLGNLLGGGFSGGSSGGGFSGGGFSGGGGSFGGGGSSGSW